MKIFYAVEANTIIEEVPEFKELLRLDTELVDYIDSSFVYESAHAADEAEQLLREADLYENRFKLVHIEQCTKGETFEDFAIVTSTNSYLIMECICAFTIIGGTKEAVQMAILQLEEHLICVSFHNSSAIYVVEHHLKDLVKGIAKAYDIEVSFFELDKQEKTL